jgi:ferredoxin, 2Fe-2S
MPTVSLLPSGRSVDVPQGARLIEVIRDAGLPIAAACGDELICARCGVRILRGPAGRESDAERDAKLRNRVDPELRLACAVRVRADLTVTADYWGGPGEA